MEEDEFYEDYYEDEPCDHDGYDVDLLAGRAQCFRCGEAWWLSDAQLRRELELASQMWLEAEDDGDVNEEPASSDDLPF